MKTKTIALLLAVALVFGGIVGGTVAWLVDSTETVTNTFTAAGIDITLTETYNTDTDDDDKNDAWEAQLIPGKEYTKDPMVAVVRPTTDVDIYLFVKFEETNNPATYLTYISTLTKDNGWTQGNGTEIPNNVWYRTVKADDDAISWNLLVGNKVTVKDLQKNQMPNENLLPSLTYTAYAIQTEGSADAATAWEKISN